MTRLLSYVEAVTFTIWSQTVLLGTEFILCRISDRPELNLILLISLVVFHNLKTCSEVVNNYLLI